MKTLKLPFWIAVLTALFTLETVWASDTDDPTITGIALVEGEVVVTVNVPPGIKRIILESKIRLGRGAWVPRGVKRLDGMDEAEIEFRVKFDSRSEMLRVRATDEEELPTAFYEGDSSFNGEVSTVEQGGVDPRFSTPETAAPGTDATDSNDSAEVVESDIWQIDGDRVYFFNQYKGLQVIDITDPDNPAILGTLDLASAGEQMYMLGSDHVVLLARDNCDYGPSAQSRIMIIDVSTGDPVVAAVAEFGGVIQESRMLGTAIYLVTQSYERVEEAGADSGGTWEWSTKVYSFDLSDPTGPVARDRLKYPGYGTMATAQKTKLFVNVVERYWSEPAEIQIVDISAADGSMVEQGRIEAAGLVADKFKIHLKDDVVSVVSEVRAQSNLQTRHSRMENFSIADPDQPLLVGYVNVGGGESLYATRFDGDLVYIVTFRQVDPLWIVDNSNPLKPVVAGEVEIPGWSNYIHPLGDRLVTIGIDNIDGWRASVQLFDVSDPTAPALLSKAPLGEGSSWSEANYDEKAFRVFPDEGLILVPFSSYSSSGGYASAVQLIDLNRDSLTQRGVIEHQMQPRRATYVSERILSISGREFLVVDGTDRDNPVVTADLTLSWPVSRLVEYGDYLVEVVDDANSLGAGTLTVVSKPDLDAIFDEVGLREGWTLAGMTERAGKLYTLQVKGESSWVYYPEDTEDGAGDVPTPEPEENILLTVYDLNQLPGLVELGSVVATTDEIWSWTQFQPVWPREDVLVWNGGNNYSWGPWFAVDALAADIAMPRWGGGGSGRLIAFDVADASEPALTSDLDVLEDRNVWNTSRAYPANGVVYISHQRSIYYQRGELPPGVDWPARLEADPVEGIWMQQYFLDVVDYADASEPTIRPELNVPGTLIGLSDRGSVIYTQGYHWKSDATSDYRNWIDASAYDGLEAHLIDSIWLRGGWPQPIVADGSLFIGVAGDTSSKDAGNAIETWHLGDDGAFARTGLFEVTSPASEFRRVGDLLVVRTYDGIRFLGLPGAGQILDRGELGSTGCYWLDLSSADGNMSEGLWVPMRTLGVGFFPVAPDGE